MPWVASSVGPVDRTVGTDMLEAQALHDLVHGLISLLDVFARTFQAIVPPSTRRRSASNQVPNSVIVLLLLLFSNGWIGFAVDDFCRC
ncbi:hypothetical protein GALMADRAFT_240746 [Galerina marginata CBS 339.88]|uniref:Uncharacterized protein n=1 Tax=Galerina marginata (strain CBS 339.88) TaxID=685588 RepID=A0A067TTC0_GALM3|nr:hypothetical protein GALMADRAFT_240746 [Galerina marginata CBS 339.88]